MMPIHTARQRAPLVIYALVFSVMLIAGCGNAPTPSTASRSVAVQPSGASASGATSANGTVATAGSAQQPFSGPQYLSKSLQVHLAVRDPRREAATIQSWVAATDPKSTSAGMDYAQLGDGTYAVTLTFSVEATMYPQVERYLADYAEQHGGRLAGLHETVQDVTNDYVDTQSRLTNLRTEQQRLRTLLASAQSLNDVLTIDQRLTDVEGQIEDIESHLAILNSQIAYYMVTVNLQPNSISAPSPRPVWNPGQTWHDALAAALSFAQLLATLLIWLGVFSIFVLPPIGLAWAIVRRRRARHLVSTAKPASPLTP